MANEDKLQLAKEALASGTYDKETIEYIFPELRESEDEKIRKEIIQFLQLPHPQFVGKRNYEEWIAWLEKQDTKLQEYINEERNKKDFYCEGKEMSWNEMPLGVKKHDYPYYFKGDLDCYPFNTEKQGEQKPIEQDTETHDLWMYIREWNDKFGRLPNDEDELAACIDYVMKRQKPADKAEPKFKVGDWLVSDCNNVAYIESISETKYNLQCIDWYHEKMPVEYVDRYWHLWTIQDAKDGDVLAYPDGTIVLFKYRLDGLNSGIYMSHILLANEIETCQSCAVLKDIHPATKEQCYLLFQKMKEAGYEWDAEKKELKNIPNALEECEIEHIENGKYYYCIKDYYSGGYKKVSKGEVVQVSKGMSMMGLGVKANEYFIPVEQIVDAKPTWSEEDEKLYTSALWHIKNSCGNGGKDSGEYEVYNWLKSIKDRVQPQPTSEWNEEDEENRINAIKHLELFDAQGIHGDVAIPCINWLKSLNPQNRWKPSEEQMEELEYVTRGNSYPHLSSLYQYLKNL